MMSGRAVLLSALWFALAASTALRAGMVEAWEAVIALDQPPATELKSREQARQLTLQKLDRQEEAVRRFIELYPAAPKTVDARLRLARIYFVRGDLSGDASQVEKAFATLAALQADPALPAERKADAAFASLSLRMQQAQQNLKAERAGLVTRAEAFRKAFPGDRRLAPLFAELAGVFEDEPVEQRRLLEIARPLAREEGVKMQIADDLRRNALWGKTVDLQFKSIDGQKIDLRHFRGKVVVLVFYADFSPPSILALARVEEIARSYPPHSVQCLGVSLDSSAAATRKLLDKFEIDWPVFCDGKGWESPLVRRCGINTLPTVWIFDRRGRLRVLNAPEEPVAAVQSLMRER